MPAPALPRAVYRATLRPVMSPHRQPPLPHIVVIGAGFGGMAFCQDFPAKLARITLIDRQNHHLFQPLLYQVAAAGLSAVDIAQPVRAIFGARPNFDVIMAEVTGIDLAAAFEAKMASNERKYPAAQVRGKYKKPKAV